LICIIDDSKPSGREDIMKNNQLIFSVVFVFLLIFTAIGIIIGEPQKIDCYGFGAENGSKTIREDLDDLDKGYLVFRYMDDTKSGGDAVSISIILEDEEDEVIWSKHLSSVPFNALVNNIDIVDISEKGDYELIIYYNYGDLRIHVDYGKDIMPFTLCSGCCLMPITALVGFVIVLNNNRLERKKKRNWKMDRYT
jgi:hypothetical protein